MGGFQLKLGIHNGLFHADELFVVAMISEIFADIEVVRTRNTEVLATCDIVADVGGGKYDHHQVNKEVRVNGIPYAAAGLVWQQFGESIVRHLGVVNYVEDIVRTVDETLIQGIDAVDNGVQLQKDEHIMSVSSIVSLLVPRWNETTDMDEAFLAAVPIAKTILHRVIRKSMADFAANSCVEAAMGNRSNSAVLVLDTTCPWTQWVLELDKEETIEFVVFPDLNQGWRVQVVPKELGKFAARKNLPESWAGKSAEVLSALADVPDAIFCHPGRFIAGAISKESVIKMAMLAL
jgi:uncharacterized UPF0160 family protein